MDKKQLRAQVFAARKMLSAQQLKAAEDDVCRQLCQTKQYKSASCLYCYMSFNNEVPTEKIFKTAWKAGKRTAVPVTQGEEMRFVYITAETQLIKDRFGISVPADTANTALEEDALMLVPGAVFDHSGNRIGYGGGFYDRYLANHPSHPTIGLCYDFQVVDQIEKQEHDIPVGRLLVIST